MKTPACFFRIDFQLTWPVPVAIKYTWHVVQALGNKRRSLEQTLAKHIPPNGPLHHPHFKCDGKATTLRLFYGNLQRELAPRHR